MKKIKPSQIEKQWEEDLERRGVFDPPAEEKENDGKCQHLWASDNTPHNNPTKCVKCGMDYSDYVAKSIKEFTSNQ